MRSEASAQLEVVVRRHGAAAVARTVGASEAAVRSWVKGERCASGARRDALRTAYGIEDAAWQLPARTVPPPATRPDAEAAPQGSRQASQEPTPQPSPPAPVAHVHPQPDDGAEVQVVTVCRATVRRLERELDRLVLDKSATARERASVATSLTAATRLLARLSGQLEITHAAILRSAAWKRILRTFEDVFTRHPEAAPALAEFAAALREMGE